MDVPADLHAEGSCRLTTQGRVTGRRHTAELWFLPTEGGVYLLSGSGGLTQWSLNLQAGAQAVLTIAGRSWLARASFLAGDDPRRTELVAAFREKYRGESTGIWARAATIVQLVLTHELET